LGGGSGDLSVVKLKAGECKIYKCKIIENCRNGILIKNPYFKKVDIQFCKINDNYQNGINIIQDLEHLQGGGRSNGNTTGGTSSLLMNNNYNSENMQ